MQAGRVMVNGQCVRELGARIDPIHDRVAVDGHLLKTQRKLYVALNKPKGYLCTRQDPGQRKIVADLLPKEWNQLYPVGRLDMESEGLLFLTNDGTFCLRLTHPRYGIRKTYRATIEGRFEPTAIAQLKRGVWHDGDLLRAAAARLISSNHSHSVVELVLTEGKNREVRRIFAALAVNVSRLQRIQIGRIKLGELRPGHWRTLTKSEINSLIA